MTAADTALIITAFGTPLMALGVIVTAVLTYRNGRESRLGREVIQKELTIVKDNTNGLVSKLIIAKDDEATAKAELSERDGHSQGLANGLSEARLQTMEQGIKEVQEAQSKK